MEHEGKYHSRQLLNSIQENWRQYEDILLTIRNYEGLEEQLTVESQMLKLLIIGKGPIGYSNRVVKVGDLHSQEI